MKTPHKSTLVALLLPVSLGLVPLVTLAEKTGITQTGNIGIQANLDTNVDSTSTQNNDSPEGVSNNEVDSQTSDVQEQDGDQNDEEIDITRDSLDAEASSTVHKGFEHSRDVHTKTELQYFAENKIKSDENADEVKVSSTTVETAYPMHAKLFGFIPLSLYSHVSVNTDGTVNLTLPWYAFLFGTDQDKVKADLVQAARTTIGSNTASTSLSTTMQAQLLEAVLATLHANFSSSN